LCVARERKKTAAAHAERSRGYTVRQTSEHYREEHLSQLARGAEVWRILEREILTGIGSRLFVESFQSAGTAT